jgi:hypothetical protein
MKRPTTDHTDFADDGVPALQFNPEVDIRLIREIRGLLQSAKRLRFWLV